MKRLNELFAPLWTAGFALAVQGPLAAGRMSEPEPDFAVVEAKDYSKEYWVVDVPAGEVVVHRGPRETGYAEVRVALAGETLHPVALPQLVDGIDVSALLP